MFHPYAAPEDSIGYSPDELVALIQANDRKAFDYLYKHYANGLYLAIRLIIKDEHVAQDVLQETFVKIWVNFSKYIPAKSGLYCWMRKIACNTAIDTLRSKGSVMRSKSSSDVTELHDYYKINPEHRADTMDLQQFIIRLKPDHQVLIQLAYFNGFTFEQIAEVLHKPIGTIKTRMRLALGMLRSQLKPE